MKKVLVILESYTYGSDPYFFLIERLRGKFEFLVATYDAVMIEEAKKRGIKGLLLKKGNKKATKERHRGRFLRMFSSVFMLYDEFLRHRFLAFQARSLVEQVRPDAILLPTDGQGLCHHVCNVSRTHTVIPQITMDLIDVDARVDYHTTEMKRISFSQVFCKALSRLLGRNILVQLKPGIYKPENLWKSIGGLLGGFRYGFVHKGGSGGKRLCVNGCHYARTFAEGGVDEKKIVVTGSPDHDRLVEFAATFDNSGMIALKEQLGISPDSQFITLFLQTHRSMSRMLGQDYTKETIWAVQELLNATSDMFVIVKIHPKDTLKQFWFLNNNPRVLLVSFEHYPGEDFNNQLIASSRLVVLQTSTVGFSVMALDVPLVTYHFADNPSGKIYQKIGGGFHVDRHEDFLPSVKKLLFDERQRQEIIERQCKVRDKYMILDGRCCERIGEVLAQDF